MTITIYGLSDSASGEVRYVGRTSHSLRKRLTGHMNAVRLLGDRVAIGAWVRDRQGVAPDIFEIEQTTPERANELERFWIEYLTGIGCHLLNRARGGGALGFKRSSANRQAIGVASKARWARQRDEIVAAQNIGKADPAHRARLSRSITRRWEDPAYSAGLSRSHATKLSDGKVETIKRRLLAGEPQTKIAKDFGVDPSVVCHINRGRRWKHVSAIAQLGG